MVPKPGNTFISPTMSNMWREKEQGAIAQNLSEKMLVLYNAHYRFHQSAPTYIHTSLPEVSSVFIRVPFWYHCTVVEEYVVLARQGTRRGSPVSATRDFLADPASMVSGTKPSVDQHFNASGFTRRKCTTIL